MITQQVGAISAAAILTFGQLTTQLLSPMPEQQMLASHEFSLDNRYNVKSVSDVFKNNILLNWRRSLSSGLFDLLGGKRGKPGCKGPNQRGSHARQNLYVTNNKDKPITFMFDYLDDKLKVSVAEVN